MGVHVLEADWNGQDVAVLVDSVTEVVFGHVFHADWHEDGAVEAAESFLTWLRGQPEGPWDARLLSDAQLEDAFGRWVAGVPYKAAEDEDDALADTLPATELR